MFHKNKFVFVLFETINFSKTKNFESKCYSLEFQKTTSGILKRIIQKIEQHEWFENFLLIKLKHAILRPKMTTKIFFLNALP